MTLKALLNNINTFQEIVNSIEKFQHFLASCTQFANLVFEISGLDKVSQFLKIGFVISFSKFSAFQKKERDLELRGTNVNTGIPRY